jgi:hypothetical protein
MKPKIGYVAGVLLLGLALLGVTYAQRPETNINPGRHPELAEAQRHMVEAYDKIKEAQAAHHDELGGHADKAIEFLEKASVEIKSAAEYADHHH